MPLKGNVKDFSFFGEIDLNDKGKIRSDTPSWYFDVHIDELEESIARKSRAVDGGLVDPEVALRMKSEIKNERKKLTSIKSSQPKLSGAQTDLCATTYSDLKKQIRDTMPSRKEDRDGLVSPQEEYKRMKTKHIRVNEQVAKACGCKPINGKISGDEANKCFKIIGKHIGESTNVERLRKDGGGEAYKTMNDLAQAILGGKQIGAM